MDRVEKIIGAALHVLPEGDPAGSGVFWVSGTGAFGSEESDEYSRRA